MSDTGGFGLRYKGLPYRGNVTMFTEQDHAMFKPKKGAEAHCKVFKLWVEDDLKEYNAILNEAANNPKACKIREEKTQWIAKENSWAALVTWVCFHYEKPEGVRKDLDEVLNRPNPLAGKPRD